MNFYYIPVVVLLVLASSIAYVRFIWPAIETRRILSSKICGEPVKKCPEGEEAYFHSHPDVAERWKPRSAYHHWKKYGKAEGRSYVCHCSEAIDKVDHKPEGQKDGGFVVVAVFKNEGMNFAEWISHYLWQGASHFYLIDNGSTDDWKSNLSLKDLARINVTRNEGSHIQTHSYNSLLPMLQERHSKDWALIVR